MTEQELLNLKMFNKDNFDKLYALVCDHSDILSTKVVTEEESVEALFEGSEDPFTEEV